MMDSSKTVKQATEFINRAEEENKNENYQNAVHFYEKGIEAYRYAIEHEQMDEKDKQDILNKCVIYIDKVENLLNYLRSNYQEKIHKCEELLNRAIKEDENKNYSVAVRLYDEALEQILQTAETENLEESTKENIRARCKVYKNRAEELKEYLKEDHIPSDGNTNRENINECPESNNDTQSKLRFFCPCFFRIWGWRQNSYINFK